ncbi:winged helix-turn-helix transcriptional regulator [Thermobifida halotolerans]|uniref:Winged helix-turn-helix transcriptional regulator n=1 Tax=Thermobifida halotolerans TaxID=483545 RepID=A0AA97M5J4_9ACTN|nr:metalloregulator ArsR/SmtB family transcription factor [Thermobifida halotolerans]UOE21032.1 winged helix-turn-helix transcriptional regulator [Thermobifida halotolerans]
MTMTPEENGETGEGTVLAPDALAPTAALFRGLSDPTRLAILHHLTFGEHRVRDLTDHLGLAQSTISAHLSCLRDCGLVTSRPRGRASLFSLTSAPELLDVLTAAKRLLHSTGDAPALCPNYGVDAPTRPAPPTSPDTERPT